MSVLEGSDDVDTDVWEEENAKQPSCATIAVERTAREIETLLATYPVKVSKS